jgi:hypothetical protein
MDDPRVAFPIFEKAQEFGVNFIVRAPTGVLIGQQTAANLHVRPGDIVSVGGTGLCPQAVLCISHRIHGCNTHGTFLVLNSHNKHFGGHSNHEFFRGGS